MSLLCIAIFVEDAAQARRDVARAAEVGADLVELRIDRLRYGEAVAAIGMTGLLLPVIKFLMGHDTSGGKVDEA